MKTLKNLFILSFLPILLFACSTLPSRNVNTSFLGASQKIPIISNPPLATVIVGKRIVGRTPISIKLDPRKNYTIIIARKGYKPALINLYSQYAPNATTSTVDILYPGTQEAAVYKASSDSMGLNYRLIPEEIRVNLELKEKKE